MRRTYYLRVGQRIRITRDGASPIGVKAEDIQTADRKITLEIKKPANTERVTLDYGEGTELDEYRLCMIVGHRSERRRGRETRVCFDYQPSHNYWFSYLPR